jgi:SAM-dependent methyltransferase
VRRTDEPQAQKSASADTATTEPESKPAPRPNRTEAVATRRPAYQADLADGLERFFGPRRTSCPWCGSAQLRERLRTTDLLQHKPGRFSLDRCVECGHVFQNPQLSAAGLEFYYRDFYDGLGEKSTGGLFAGRGRMYRRRAASLAPHAEKPASWLDVGTGHGHFCEAARDVFPDTAFDGLDFTDGAEIAERAGRVRRGYRGSFVELAPSIAGEYDVISMFHYLEHAAEPEPELAAAHLALRPGGHLLIEVPDPESRYARLLGRRWLPWLQPQHLHFIPAGNLRRRLDELGFTVLAEQHAEPHDPIDLLAATWFVADNLAPREDAPWHARRPGLASRVGRSVIVLLSIPALAAAALLDRLVARGPARRFGLTNAYRLIARRD